MLCFSRINNTLTARTLTLSKAARSQWHSEWYILKRKYVPHVLLLISYILFRNFAYMAVLLIKTIKTFQYLVTSPLKFKNVCFFQNVFFSLLNNARPFIFVAYLFRTLIACESRDFCVITILIAHSAEYLLNSKHKVISLFILEDK